MLTGGSSGSFEAALGNTSNCAAFVLPALTFLSSLCLATTLTLMTVEDHGGQTLADDVTAADVADALARRVYEVRPDLRNKGYPSLSPTVEGRQVHRAPPLDRPTLAGERPTDPGRTFQSTFQSESPDARRGATVGPAE